ncbi:endonuclease domain-containing protein [Sphingomonas cavernae]|uniref:endonuclease domain-containing protein n=1 Tax=Sphingomonas cavernae TaxID=2320861 RepID=UPI001EE5D27F|nr:endonuclease domain-containing protein [Sphingomonas cavernae]
MTDVERRVWHAVRDRRLEGFKFRRQATIGPFVVDFLCVEAGLIVELDGGQRSVEADAPRTAYLEEQGYRLLRFWNSEVSKLSKAFSKLSPARSTTLEQERRRPSPNPLPRKRERAQGMSEIGSKAAKNCCPTHRRSIMQVH